MTDEELKAEALKILRAKTGIKNIIYLNAEIQDITEEEAREAEREAGLLANSKERDRLVELVKTARVAVVWKEDTND